MTALPNRDRRAERRSATRREILDAAWSIARQRGIADVTLREVADRVGMRPPSLYSHFDSKNSIYDAMFAEAWDELVEFFEARPTSWADPRKGMLADAETFVDFATADVARYQLMNQRMVPDFEPSEESYNASIRAYERMRSSLRERGVRSQSDLDIWTALLGGIVNQQLANDPGGSRWRRLLPRVVDMFCDDLGMPAPRLRRNR